MSNILVIDDDRIILNTLNKTLSFLGHNVKIACDGDEGIAAFSDGIYFNFVITDINMPKFTGYTVAKYIRTSDRRNTPIIAITGSIDNNHRDLFDFVLMKPFKIEDLVDTLGLLHKHNTKIFERSQLMFVKEM